MKGTLTTITIHHLEVHGIIGVHEHERSQPQTLYLDLELKCHVPQAHITDHLTDTLDYNHLAQGIQHLVKNSQYHLIETLVNKIADDVFNDLRIVEVLITLKKPKALSYAQYVSVTTHRSRK